MVKSVLLIEEDHLSLFISSKIIEIAAPHVSVITCSSIARLPRFFAECIHNQTYPDLILAGFSRPVGDNIGYLEFLSHTRNYARVVALGLFLERDIDLFKKYGISEHVIVPLSVAKIEEIIHSKPFVS